jgi:hypothetical protein
LAKAFPNDTIRRTHFLSRELIAKAKHSKVNTSLQKQIAYAREVRSLLVRRRIFARHESDLPRIHLLCGVREPASHLLSRNFQNSARFNLVLGKTQPADIAKQITLFAQKHRECKGLYSDFDNDAQALYFADWFDLEPRVVFGLDVFSEPFDWEKGFRIIESANVRIFIYRQENLSQLQSELAHFVGAEKLEFVNTNVRDETEWAGLYRTCQSECFFPDDVLDYLYSLRYTQHFYSPAERAEFRERWSGKRKLAANP